MGFSLSGESWGRRDFHEFRGQYLHSAWPHRFDAVAAFLFRGQFQGKRGSMDKAPGRSGLRRGFGWTGVNMYPGFETAALLTKKALSDMASANAQYGWISRRAEPWPGTAFSAALKLGLSEVRALSECCQILTFWIFIWILRILRILKMQLKTKLIKNCSNWGCWGCCQTWHREDWGGESCGCWKYSHKMLSFNYILKIHMNLHPILLNVVFGNIIIFRNF